MKEIPNAKLIETANYPNGGKSFFYVSNDTAYIVDKDIWVCNKKEDSFPYSLITNKQNEYVHSYSKVYRCIEEDIENLLKLINDDSFDDFSFAIGDRNESLEASLLEMKFENSFANAYGANHLDALEKEYCITDGNGHQFFLDYVIETDKDRFAIEENGVSYHHPQIIGKERYRNQLKKQNICTKWGIKLFRFSSEDCAFEGRIEDDIKRYFGDNPESFKTTNLYAERKFKLYEHQAATLKDIEEQRKNGTKAFLSVLPTAAGKSQIVIEDIKRFCTEPTMKILILCPSTDIVLDWNRRVRKDLNHMKNRVDIRTYAHMMINFKKYSPEHYGYIVVDEAHHAVAPVLKRVIQYFNPQFLFGITATDKRPDAEKDDSKKLESVFGEYKTSLTLKEAMDRGIVATANVYRLETNINLSKVRFNGKDYVNADLEKTIRVNSRNELIVNVIKEYFCSKELAKKQGVIFCVNKKHTIEIENLMKKSGISCASYTSDTQNAEKVMDEFKKGNIRFLSACSKISEGWDFPELGILVMARPTMSKVLYLQQIGRGLRKTSTKSNVFVIDIVDEYGSMVRPCSLHSIFQNPFYVPFGAINKQDYQPGEFVEVSGLKERIERIIEVDINTFEDKYGDYFNQEQLAREYYVNTHTIISWVKKNKLKPDQVFKFGSRDIYLFSPETVNQYRIDNKIPVHNDETIYDDFFSFLEERDYTLSYKMPFMLGFLENMNSIGDAKIDDILDYYINFYLDRVSKGIPVDKESCPYNSDTLKDRKFILDSMLTNPFEKFERKRFLHYSKDLGIISMNHALFVKIDNNDVTRIKKQLNQDLTNYYNSI